MENESQWSKDETPATAVEAERHREHSWLRRSAFVAAPALFVAFLAFGLLRTTGPKASPGSKGPEFVLPILGGEGTLSSKQLEGKPIVVNFWASWCVPCREEAPLLERAWRSYRGQGIKFLGVNTQDAEEDALDFVREFEITYPNVRDVNQELGGQMGVLGLPETFFIDHRYRFAGASAGEQIGTRGKTVIRGAISSAVLRGNVEALLARMREP